jgi:hypothetical protein
VGGLLGGEQDGGDLSAMAGKTVRLPLPARDCPRARIGHPRVTAQGPASTPLPKVRPSAKGAGETKHSPLGQL